MLIPGTIFTHILHNINIFMTKDKPMNDSGLVGLGATILGYISTIAGGIFNMPNMQMLAFLFTAFAGFATGVYYLVKAYKELRK